MKRKPTLATILQRQARLRAKRSCLTCDTLFRVKSRSPENSGMTKYCQIECYHQSVREKARKKILEKFSLTREQWMDMRQKCGDRCQICGNPETVMNNAKTSVINLTIDHDHKTGAVRGLLCVRCNFGLSHIDSSEAWLENAARYLRAAEKSPLESVSGINRALRIMREYLDLRLEMKDYHGVMDAAADIRELEAQLRVMKGNR